MFFGLSYFIATLLPALGALLDADLALQLLLRGLNPVQLSFEPIDHGGQPFHVFWS
jgi:hypothetical protein